MTAMTDDERYAAIRARDARFDGMFFTCVRSTGIFCRPSCPARTPSRTGVEFVPSAAAAAAAGYRACKRCGPAAPPGSPDSDPSGSLAGRALQLIEAGALDDGGSVPALARRLAVSERTLHRALVSRTGAGALAHARIRRARRAHELVSGSDVPLAAVAHASGFGSERQFHDTFSQLFGHAPSVVRGRAAPRDDTDAADLGGAGHAGAANDAAQVRADLAVRRPFDGEGLARWFAARALPGVEHVEGLRWQRAVSLPHGPAVLQVDLGAEDGPLPMTAHLADLRDYAAAVALARRMLDLDADPRGIDAGLAAAMPALATLVEARPGVRIPGTPSLPEALLWAIVGQQISTVRARALLVDATDLAGHELPAALRTAHVHRLAISPAEAGARAEEWFRGPGARRRTLTAALTAPPDPDLPVPELRERLLAIRGIGPWTADYALLRGARAVDVAPARDVALLAVARALDLADDFAALDEVLGAASPWRSYAVMHLWHHRDSLPAHQRTLRKDRS